MVITVSHFSVVVYNNYNCQAQSMQVAGFEFWTTLPEPRFAHDTQGAVEQLGQDESKQLCGGG